MNEVAATDLADLPPAASRAQSNVSASAYPQSLLDLPPGEARASLRAVQEILSSRLPSGQLAIYEAGGGSTSFLPLGMWNRAHVTVVDIDADQLRNNDYAQEKILGDIQTLRFKPNSFDLVVCYNVIEHLPDVLSALTGFFGSLKRGGLILIGAPNPKSLSGVVTRYTPHWFHVWFYRYVLGDTKAGLPGEAPFPTFFHPLVTPANLDAFAWDEFPAAAKDRRAPGRLSHDPEEALTMPAMVSRARATAGHRPAASLRADSASRICGSRHAAHASHPAPTLNETLNPDRAVRMGHSSKKSRFRHGRYAVGHAALNGFFAISANSPSMSMVNFSCCVRSALLPSASGVIRRVAPQPTRMAVRMEAGANADL
jgi:SAM-dependent methyltransferase